MRSFLPCYPWTREKSPNPPVISDSRETGEPPKNSWRSLDRGGNGYLGVYEGGARSRRAGGTREVCIYPRYRQRRHPEGGRKGSRFGGNRAEGARRRMRERCLPLVRSPRRSFEKGAVGGSGEAAVLSKDSSILFLSPSPPRLNLNITASQVQFLSSIARSPAPYWARTWIHDRSGHRAYLDDVESESIGSQDTLAPLTTARYAVPRNPSFFSNRRPSINKPTVGPSRKISGREIVIPRCNFMTLDTYLVECEKVRFK